MLVVAEQQGQTVAAALNLVGSHCVYGRNWGSIGGREFKNLHFEVCYYQVGPASQPANSTAALGQL
jgi:predicted N-acyltransferase